MAVQQRRPRDEIEEMLLHNTRDANGAWVGETFRKGDWIFLQPSAIGPHRVRQRGVMEHHWKGHLQRFKKLSNGNLVAIVKHVYTPQDIYIRQQTRFPCNCKYNKVSCLHFVNRIRFFFKS